MKIDWYYWTKSLNDFQEIISEILKRFKTVSNNMSTELIYCDVYKQLYLKSLKDQILLTNPTNLNDLPKLFDTTQKITDEVWTKLR